MREPDVDPADGSEVVIDDDGPPRPPAGKGPGARGGVRLGDRFLAVGKTGEGKSELVAHLFAVHTGRRILIDVNDDYHLGSDALREGACEAERLRDVDWRCRTIRYVPATGSGREYDELHRAIFAMGDTLVWDDEAEDVAPVHKTPRWVKKVVKQGRKKRITYLAATQRPRGVERSVINQAEHAAVFRMVDPDDIRALATRMAIDARELGDELANLPEHGFLYHRIGEREVQVLPPLPPAILAQTRRHVVIP